MIPVNEEKKEELEKEEQVEAVETEVVEKPKEDDKLLKEEYLNLARVIQADFDNYRKRSIVQIERAKVEGIASTVEILLPSLDAFKNVKEKVKDPATLEGINMLERQIMASLEKLGVEKIEAEGKELDPNVHNALAVGKDPKKPDGIILQEFQAGYKMKVGNEYKVIRCAQVLVNKL